MVVGTLGFVLASAPGVSEITSSGLAPAVLILTLGTYLVGTDMSGRPV